MRLVSLLVVVAACGGKATPKTTPSDRAAKAAETEREQLEKERPVPPYETREVHGFKTSAVCGQGPYRVATKALGARFGERVQVTVCAKQSFEADYRFTSGKDAQEARHFGYGTDDKRCLATAHELAQAGTGGGSGTGGSGKAGTAAKPATTSATPVTLEEVTVAGSKCPDGLFPVSVLDHGYLMEDGIPVTAGTPFVVDVWSDKPIHLEGALFLIHQTAVRRDVTVEAWKEFRARDDAYWTKYRALVERDVAAGRSHYVDQTPHSAEAPPPAKAETQPPRPSEHAEWIPGYWHRDGEWAWIPGLWRVPEADIAANKTVEAPVAPPPVREEVAVKRPTAVAVWTPGYWAWDGRAYVWIAGAWRIPPSAGGVWIAPTWRARGARVQFVPGGWSVRLRR